MLIKKTRKIKVLELVFTETGIAFTTVYNNTYTDYIFEDEVLDEFSEQIELFQAEEHNLYLWIQPESKETTVKKLKFGEKEKEITQTVDIPAKLVDMTVEMRDPMEIFKPVTLASIEYKTLKFIPFFYGREIYLQRDGFHLLVGPTGSGKTYMAIDNLPTLEKNYDIVLYLSLEVTALDIKNRYVKRHKREPGENIIIGQTISVKQIEEYIGDKSACVIVDNVDNLVRTGEGAFDTQLQFVMEFDEWAKRTGNTGIFLTQITKDFKDNLVVVLDKRENIKDINPDMTFNSVAGVKQLATMSRSVMLTHYDHPDKYSKLLKKGSALFDRELNEDERKTFIR